MKKTRQFSLQQDLDQLAERNPEVADALSCMYDPEIGVLAAFERADRHQQARATVGARGERKTMNKIQIECARCHHFRTVNEAFIEVIDAPPECSNCGSTEWLSKRPVRWGKGDGGDH